MKKDQLLRFIDIRNESSFCSNLQFSIDAQEAGFKVEELGQAFRQWGEDGQINGYRWDTEHGVLVEHLDGHLELK